MAGSFRFRKREGRIPGRFQEKKIAYTRFRAKYGQHDSSAAGQMRVRAIGGVEADEVRFREVRGADAGHFQGKKIAYMGFRPEIRPDSLELGPAS